MNESGDRTVDPAINIQAGIDAADGFFSISAEPQPPAEKKSGGGLCATWP